MGKRRPLIERFEEKYVPEPMSGCWLWVGCVTGDGYGQIWNEGRLLMAHRASLMLAGVHVEDNLIVMHRCDNPPCVNPDHLRVGTTMDNVADKIAKGRQRNGSHIRLTECRRGHPFTPDNTVVGPDGYRLCRTCRNKRQRERYAAITKRARAQAAISKATGGGV